MRSILVSLAVAVVCLAADDPLLLQKPTLNKTHIVFAYAGDLWSVPRDGGDAVRLTSGPGIETDPKFSPDGTRIAFTGEYDGNVDVFVMPAAGGVPKRLDLAPGGRIACSGWTPDGKRIIFSLAAERRTRVSREMFTVPAEGGVEEKLPLPSGYEASMSPDGQSIAYEPDRAGIHRCGSDIAAARPRASGSPGSPTAASPRCRARIRTTSTRCGPGTASTSSPTATGRRRCSTTTSKRKAVHEAIPNQGLDLKSASLGPDAIVYEQFGGISLYDLKTRQDEAGSDSRAGRFSGTAHASLSTSAGG